VSDDGEPGYAGTPGLGLALPPWEERQRFGFLNSLYLTIREVIISPDQFFARMPTRLGLWQPLLFAIIVGTISTFFDWMWSLAGSSLRVLMENDVLRLFRNQFFSMGLFVLSPALVFAEVFLRAGLVHLCLMLVDGNRAGFEATFRVAAYTEAVWIISIFPLCGNLLALFWGTALAVIGLQRAHQTETWRAALAVLLPLLVCLASCGGLLLITLGKRLLS
jgi:hypothetical protein